MRKKLRGVRFMFTMSFQAAPLLAAGTFGFTALGAILAPAAMWATKLLIDGLYARDASAVLRAILLLGLFRVAATGFLSLGNSTLRMNMEDRTRLHIDTLMLNLGAGIAGIEHFERRDFADEMAMLRRQAGSLAQPAGPVVFLVQVIVTGAGTLALLASIHVALLLVPLFGIPGVIFGTRNARRAQRVQESVIERIRLGVVTFRLAVRAAPAKEVRIFGLAPELERRVDQMQREVLREETVARAKSTLLAIAGSMIFAAGYIGALALVVRQAVRGDGTVGDVVLALAATATVSGLVSQLVVDANWLTRTLKTIDRFLWLVDYAKEVRRPVGEPAPVPERITDGIRFENVSFTYPGTDAVVLSDVDLFFPAGGTVAIVGDNGAGKTTLVKLLCRFYETTSGTITVDGIDLRRFDHEEWRARIAAGFQDFSKFEFLARETVGVGDLEQIESEHHVLDALDRASASDVLSSLPTGLASQLGKSFEGGVELSTGEWQKLALGRALMRETPLLLLLDEPTASLDAQTEHALFERYAAEAQGAAARAGAVTVLVSHRFSTVRMADLIVVVEGGRITEVGSHDDLMARNATYAELFEIQARAYR